MQTTDFKTILQKGIIKNISKLHVNANGYPFVTLVNSERKAFNLYFSRNSGQAVIDTFQEGESVIPFLKDARIVLTQNEKGEERYKISGGGNYETDSSIADAFGVETESNFDFEAFAKQFENETVSA